MCISWTMEGLTCNCSYLYGQGVHVLGNLQATDWAVGYVCLL